MIQHSRPGALDRARLLLGSEGLQRLAEARVIIFGVGGVGSWVAEALVRTGVGHLTIVDNDNVAPSNINRQLMATSGTVGRVKVEAMRERLLDINPMASIETVNKTFCLQTAPEFNLDSYDCVLDCIDSLADKALLIELATRSKAKFFSSMGAALKLDPTRVAVAQFWKVKGCPLARALRNRFKRTHTFPGRNFLCVYSDEPGRNREELPEPVEGKQPNGSLVHITAIFGLTLAGLAINSLTGQR